MQSHALGEGFEFVIAVFIPLITFLDLGFGFLMHFLIALLKVPSSKISHTKNVEMRETDRIHV